MLETKVLAGKEEVLAGLISRLDPSEQRILLFEVGIGKPVQIEKQGKQQVAATPPLRQMSRAFQSQQVVNE